MKYQRTSPPPADAINGTIRFDLTGGLDDVTALWRGAQLVAASALTISARRSRVSRAKTW